MIGQTLTKGLVSFPTPRNCRILKKMGGGVSKQH